MISNMKVIDELWSYYEGFIKMVPATGKEEISFCISVNIIKYQT